MIRSRPIRVGAHGTSADRAREPRSSAFAPTPGLWLPVSYYERKESELVLVRALENWFQATKATSRQEFDRILACPTPAAAKRAGRQTELRPDWEDIKFDVMVFGQGGKFTLEPYRAGLLLTHPRPLAGEFSD